MTYKTNYEPYVSRNNAHSDIISERSERSSEEVLYPLLTLYPHVAALQLQSDAAASNTDCFSGYQNVGYWADAYPTQYFMEGESKPSSRKSTASTKGRFVSKIRRFLCRDDMRREVNSSMS